MELGVWIAGPAAAGILADWGAEVVKVEPLRGDPGRLFRHILGSDMFTNPVFDMDNRGKRSISVDLTRDAGREVMDDLLGWADVFVTNVRLGGLERLGLDAGSVASRYPELIYAAITGYGMTGPDINRGAFDVASFWARSGLAHLMTPEGGDPPFQRGGMGDHSTAMSAAAAICAALVARARTGSGQVVSTSLLRQGAYTISFDLSMALGWGLTVSIGRRDTMSNPAMNNYTAGDGRRFWVVGIVAQRHWPPLARAVGRHEWLSDDRYATTSSRRDHAPALIAELDAIFATKPLAEWAEIFAGEPDLFWSPIQSPDELLADPQFVAAGGLVDVPDGEFTTPMIATPADFSGTPWTARAGAPGIGEHSEEILRDLGRTGAEIDSLFAAGVVRREE